MQQLAPGGLFLAFLAVGCRASMPDDPGSVGFPPAEEEPATATADAAGSGPAPAGPPAMADGAASPSARDGAAAAERAPMAAGDGGPTAPPPAPTMPAFCEGMPFLLCESFEGAAVATVPAGWRRFGSAQVVGDEAVRGTHALRIGAANFGSRGISRTGTIPGNHWGRVFYKVSVPNPRPAAGAVIHSTLIALQGTSPLGGRAEYRVVGEVENSQGKFQFLWNVQPQGRGEFGRGSSYAYGFDGTWQCAEWNLDADNQAFHLFIGGKEITQIAVRNGAGNYRGSEIPTTFSSITVGWADYQTATPGFVAWFDELAVDSKRIGCAL
jgi:hypothetical protein